MRVPGYIQMDMRLEITQWSSLNESRILTWEWKQINMKLPQHPITDYPWMILIKMVLPPCGCGIDI